MSERRILVIGSQCEALSQLGFLPQAAQELYQVMMDPERGACVSALEGGGLIIDPSVNDTKDAIKKAYHRAAKDEATLFIAYIGHGERSDEDFYLLPRDAENPPDSDTAVHLTNLIKEAHKKAVGQVDGLAVLIDACYAGQAGFAAAQYWVRGLGGTLRFEVLTAAANRPAADGCFSRSLTGLLRDGISAVPSEHLHCLNVRPLIEKRCPNQQPQNPSYNPDETLWLAKNAGSISEPWAQTPLADEIQRLTRAYQRTPALDEVVARSRMERCVAVIGDAGTGKSALAATLAWPKVAQGNVPARFVHAIALLTEATTPRELARILTEQLARSARGFREAQQSFARNIPYDEQQKLDTLEKQLIGPLKWLGRQPGQVAEVRIVLDALDRLATGARGSVMEALSQLSKMDFVKLVVTARPDTELPHTASSYVLAPAPDEKVRLYLEQREIPEARKLEIVRASAGSWLVARVLADLLCERPEASIGAGRLALGDAYEEMLSRCGATDDPHLQRVLEVLAAAGAGPLLPLSLLCKASEMLDGPGSPALVRDQLVRLRGLTVRSTAGTENEHAGLFHQTLVDHISAQAQGAVQAAHHALVAGVEALGPPLANGSGSTDLNNDIQRYAFEREAEHLWMLGEIDRALASLTARTSPVPRDNLRRWRLWESRLKARFGPNDPSMLTIRSNIATWTGESGDARDALKLFEALLPDRNRILGRDHLDTLNTRSDITTWTGMCGDTQKALELLEALLPDVERVLGPDHVDTLRTRANIAGKTGECGNASEALRLLKLLCPDLERALGPYHSDTLRIRAHIARFTGKCGDMPGALHLFQSLLSDRERVLGADYPDTLETRADMAASTGECGDAKEALRLFKALWPDQERVLGPDHPGTLATRSNIAYWTGECGDAKEALWLFTALWPDQERILGPDHPGTLATRSNIAYRTGECGDAKEALRSFTALRLDQERVLSPDHSDMLATRGNIAYWTSKDGDNHEALRLFKILLPEQERVLGLDHPDTRITRESISNLSRR